MTVPQKEIDGLSPIVKDLFLQWRDFLYKRVKFNMPDSEIHAAGHCERVLLYALIIGHEIFGDNPYALTALAHASVFHDTRRQDDYLDTGHGARAAVYYKQFCDESPDIDFIPEARLMMKYHDIEDKRGKVGIKHDFQGSLPRMFKLYDIFKDADALDRWRLGHGGLDPRYLRTEQAKTMVEYSRRIVTETMPFITPD
ncbi:MAG: hypothetical protein NC248_12185 [Bacteroides sp.]|nr:hypothetical protein [Bacteroides sp.]MCM1389320.1 hypothetical protein [Bacteroides sp.]